MTYLTLYELLGSSKPLMVDTIECSSFANTSAFSSSSLNLLQFTIPEGKLFYPEPFIASASYLHSDLTYLHLFQYWYWLWFLFIFLICFFLISFVSTLRWCTVRVRPRRETRGVSRSKCGDLITACVPVSWAISIIVNESADATDINDGFGTSELVVGVRAYQWGWEYYYPKSIDLNYNVKPSYNTFLGNSLYYGRTSAHTSSSQTLWRMYQNKEDDVVVTPAHILFAPLTTTSILNFSDIGINTLQETSAFAKIRNSTKAYNTNLTYIPSLTLHKYTTLHSLYFNENNLLQSSAFTMRPQHIFLSPSARNSYATNSHLDSLSFQKFLQSGVDNQNLDVNTSLLTGNLYAISSKGCASPLNSQMIRASSQLMNSFDSKFAIFLRSLLYPSFATNVNSDSDKFKLQNPLLKWNFSLSTGSRYSNIGTSFAAVQTQHNTSHSITFFDKFLVSDNSWSTQFNLNGPNSKVLLGDQSIRSSLPEVPQSPNLNFSLSMNAARENLKFFKSKNRPFNVFLGSLLNVNDYVDYQFINNVFGAQSFNVNFQPPIHSLSTHSLNSLNHDTTNSYRSFVSYENAKGLTVTDTKTTGTASDLFIGSREKTPRALNTSYWSTFWVNTNVTHRISALLALNFQRAHFYLPIFTNYSDYDFRNDQAFDLLEDLFWEISFSSYNFTDYLTLSRIDSKPATSGHKVDSLMQNFYTSTLGLEGNSMASMNSKLQDMSAQHTLYTNSIQMEDFIYSPEHSLLKDYVNCSLYSELSELEDSFVAVKTFCRWFFNASSTVFFNTAVGLSTRSYMSVFNAFRSDFEDFQVYTSTFLNIPSMLATIFDKTVTSDNTSMVNTSGNGLNSRVSNPIYLRSSVRNSVVNANAFQKVFKPRLDEGRALVNSFTFSDLAVRQPFLSDKSIPYFQLLGKNRSSFFSTPLFVSRKQPMLNTLQSLSFSTHASFYDFPFLLSKTSDTMRFTWLDWFSKWAYVEVQPSSVSRYSTIGVPYFRKPFDFNSTTGDKFQDVELYFTRVSRSRRNYLPTWLYSPLLFTRSYVWNLESSLEATFSNLKTHLIFSKYSCNQMHWYWNSPTLHNMSMNSFSYSNSGMNVYSKSTYQPRASIQSYYTSLSMLIDILSHREYLYRLVLSNKFTVSSLPQNLSVSSVNPLVNELKSSFLFSDPSTFSSESTRELLYHSHTEFRGHYLQTLLKGLYPTSLSYYVNMTNYQPLTYLAHFFLEPSTQTIGHNADLMKSQFRPLKKGISSMLRLHATGAVAMPIELRLQVLASSRDVIHSWSIPSASVKIDCVPGYTSHKMLKFFLTGVYWGQCQEICGRYHHWMPIVVYFMKRDLFFLWCTHFVFTHTPSSNWDISDRRFSNTRHFVSYDRSLWLSEFGIHR